MVIETAILLLFPAMMAFAASSDLLTMTISNRVTLTLLCGFIALALVTGMGRDELLSHVGAGFAVLVVTFIFFARGWIGGGDAKLAAVTALWFGANSTLAYFLCMALLGGLFALIIQLFRMQPLPERLLSKPWIVQLHARGTKMPYGVAMALAAFVVFPSTSWMTAIF